MRQHVPFNDAQLQASRLVGLDCLRFFAAMLALAYHYLFRGYREGGYLSVNFDSAASIFQYAYFGVPLFFMISGFVIVWSCENKNWFDFAVGRFIRLWPSYAAAVSVTAVVVLLHDVHPFQTNLQNWLANLTFVAPAFGHNFMDGVYWTIVLEIIFYFWVTVAMMTGVLSRHLLEICLAWMAIILANELWLDSGALRMVAITAYGGWFLVGVLSYQLWLKGMSYAALLMLSVAIELAIYHAMVEHTALAATYDYSIDFVSIVCASLACFLLFFATIVWGGRLRPSQLLFVLGGLTYPLYLVHQYVGYILIERLSGSLGKWGALAVTATLMLALAYAIFKWCERPIGKFLHRLIPPAKIGCKRALQLGRKIRAV